ncbi:hypothetical protein LOK49_Contig494G00005 [Camellia lanceoleosa]|nr:hypothetical protein LOK49_Contig494G00005 [Camellia lanceoleosa]
MLQHLPIVQASATSEPTQLSPGSSLPQLMAHQVGAESSMGWPCGSSIKRILRFSRMMFCILIAIVDDSDETNEDDGDTMVGPGFCSEMMATQQSLNSHMLNLNRMRIEAIFWVVVMVWF